MDDFRKSKKDNPFPINNENGQKLLLFDVNPRSIQGQTCRRAMNYNSCLIRMETADYKYANHHKFQLLHMKFSTSENKRA